MTLDEFIARLRKTPRRGWHISSYGTIRYGDSRRGLTLCPLEKVGNRLGGHAAGARIGVRPSSRTAVILAADGAFNGSPRLRRRLLAAVGLRERSEPEPSSARPS